MITVGDLISELKLDASVLMEGYWPLGDGDLGGLVKLGNETHLCKIVVLFDAFREPVLVNWHRIQLKDHSEGVWPSLAAARRTAMGPIIAICNIQTMQPRCWLIDEADAVLAKMAIDAL